MQPGAAKSPKTHVLLVCLLLSKVFPSVWHLPARPCLCFHRGKDCACPVFSGRAGQTLPHYQLHENQAAVRHKDMSRHPGISVNPGKTPRKQYKAEIGARTSPSVHPNPLCTRPQYLAQLHPVGRGATHCAAWASGLLAAARLRLGGGGGGPAGAGRVVGGGGGHAHGDECGRVQEARRAHLSAREGVSHEAED